MKRELVCVENPARQIVQVAWMTVPEANKLRHRIENDHLPLKVEGGGGFTDTTIIMTAAEMISIVMPRKKDRSSFV